jgi:hypothetical protein
MTDVGQRYVTALAAKDAEALTALFADAVDFRGMTPGRFWEAATPQEVVGVLYQWFEPTDVIERVEHMEASAVVDRQRMDYRFAVRNADGPHLVEQRVYFDVDQAGQIVKMNAICSGFRAVKAI